MPSALTQLAVNERERENKHQIINIKRSNWIARGIELHEKFVNTKINTLPFFVHLTVDSDQEGEMERDIENDRDFFNSTNKSLY